MTRKDFLSAALLCAAPALGLKGLRLARAGAVLSYLVAPSWAGRLQSNTLTFEK
jgi:hypothetical protein